ncbi:MAG: hypothetical protein ACPIOQ_26360 [Promethearchaeia archaeon]
MIQRGPPYLTAAESAYGVQEVVRNKGYEQSPECMRPPQLPGPCCHHTKKICGADYDACASEQTLQPRWSSKRAAEGEEDTPNGRREPDRRNKHSWGLRQRTRLRGH